MKKNKFKKKNFLNLKIYFNITSEKKIDSFKQ